MKNEKRQIQHGDVLIKEVDAIPEGAVPIPKRNGRLILAEGEFTGHHHAIVEKGAALYELKGELYIEVTQPVIVTHEEHKPLPIPPGIYQIGRVKEYDYFQEMERRVVD